tara:strand:- start:162 stop:392 length:231 start_codon:yes stop_codon:yes gene_type:complete
MLPQEENKSIFDEEIELAYQQLGQISLQRKQLVEQEEELEFKIRAILSTKPLRDFEKRELRKDDSKEDEQRPIKNG